MNIKEYAQTGKLERFSFLWSEARLIFAAVALAIGGRPVLTAFLPIPSLFSIEWMILKLAWIISGIASVYLLYLWNENGQRLFGGKENKDVVAFFIMIVSGINLGLTGLLGNNIGMTLLSGLIAFILTAIAYIWAAMHLYKRWKAHGEKLFG